LNTTMTALGGVKEIALQILAKFRGAVKQIGDAKGELQITERTLSRIRMKIDALPAASRPPFEAAIGPDVSRVAELTKDAGVLQSKADSVFAEIKKYMSAVGLGGGLGQVQLIAAVGLLIAGAALLWKVVVNDTKNINIKSRTTEARINGLLPAEVVERIDKQQAAGGGFSFGGVPMVLLGIAVLVLADRFRGGGRGGGGGSF